MVSGTCISGTIGPMEYGHTGHSLKMSLLKWSKIKGFCDYHVHMSPVFSVTSWKTRCPQREKHGQVQRPLT